MRFFRNKKIRFYLSIGSSLLGLIGVIVFSDTSVTGNQSTLFYVSLFTFYIGIFYGLCPFIIKWRSKFNNNLLNKKKCMSDGVNHVIDGKKIKSTNGEYKNINNNKLIELASNGDENAQYELGLRYLRAEITTEYTTSEEVLDTQYIGNGHYETRKKTILHISYVVDKVNAKKWFLVAANNGHMDAQVYLGNLAYKENNYEEAEKWFLRAIGQNSLHAKVNIAILYSNVNEKKDDMLAFKYFMDAAQLGIPIAMVAIGNYHLDGLIVKENKIEALNWFIKALEQRVSDESSMQDFTLNEEQISKINYIIGYWYFSGDGIAMNYNHSIKHFLKVSEHTFHFLDAQFHIGEMYFNGFNNSPDYKTAYNLYNKIVNYDLLLFSNSSKEGLRNAYLKLSEMYEKGIYVSADLKQAKKMKESAYEIKV